MNATWPKGEYDSSDEIGGFLNFYAQPFHLTSDDRSEQTVGGKGNNKTAIHNITLPYVNTVSNETATWDTGDNSTLWGWTDADSGGAIITDWGIDIGEWFGASAWRNEVNMELSSAGFKGPVLRQRHYSWNLINRSGSGAEGRNIANICRSFQASVYPLMNPNRTGDQIIFPPPMWTITYFPADNPADTEPGMHPTDVNKFGTPTALHPANLSKSGKSSVGGNNEWRWNMDPFTSVLMNVSISPTASTDSIQVKTASGWPLVTVLKISLLEIDQAIAADQWSNIIPWSWAQDKNSGFFAGTGNGSMYSPL